MGKVINILMFIMLVIVSAGVTYWLANKQQLVFKKPPAQILPQMEEKTYEDVLNGFLKDVDAHADAYRMQRRIPADLIKPENLKTAEYITENAALMADTIKVQREKMASVMDTFTKTDEKMNLLLVGKPEDQAIVIRDQWQILKDKQMASYVDFFSFEEDMMDTYAQLMDLYTAHVTAQHYDEVSNEIVFDDPALKSQEQDLRAKLKQISVDQIEALRENRADEKSDTSVEVPAPVTPAADQAPVSPAAE